MKMKSTCVLPSHVKMVELASMTPMVIHASVLNSTQEKDARTPCMTTVHLILATMEEFVHKAKLALLVIVLHHILEQHALKKKFLQLTILDSAPPITA